MFEQIAGSVKTSSETQVHHNVFKFRLQAPLSIGDSADVQNSLGDCLFWFSIAAVLPNAQIVLP